uniref:MFS domain-containing protein n=1 Tax=Macrostomum lignano TaxID=282301 RepID=A0A1I8HRJ4_9PLAT
MWLFSCAAIIGALGIFMQAPSLRDNKERMTHLNTQNKMPTIKRDCN